MFSSNYLLNHNGDYATLSARIKGRIIPLVSGEDRLEIESIYHNILSGVYKNARELCEDIQRNFSSQATMLVLVTLESATPVTKKHRLKQNR